MLSKETSIILIGSGLFFVLLGYLFLYDRALMSAGYLIVTFGNLTLFRPSILIHREMNSLIGLFLFTLSFAFLMKAYFSIGFVLQTLSFYYIIKERLPSPKDILRGITRQVLSLVL